MSNTTKGILFALFGFATFSTHDAIIKTLTNLGPIQILFFVLIFAFPWISAMLILNPEPKSFRPNKPWLLTLRSILGMLAGSLAFYAFLVLPMTDVYGFLFLAPIFITILSIPILGEKVGLVRFIAVILGFAGVIIMNGASLSSLGLGHLAAFLSSFFNACGGIIIRKIGKTEHEEVMLIIPFIIGILITASLMPYNYSPPSSADIYKLIIIGFLSFISQLSVVRAYRLADASIIAPMQYSQLIWAIIFGVLFFDDHIRNNQIIGAFIIVVSGIIIIYREQVKGSKYSAATLSRFRSDTIRFPRKFRDKE